MYWIQYAQLSLASSLSALQVLIINITEGGKGLLRLSVKRLRVSLVVQENKRMFSHGGDEERSQMLMLLSLSVMNMIPIQTI